MTAESMRKYLDSEYRNGTGKQEELQQETGVDEGQEKWESAICFYDERVRN